MLAPLLMLLTYTVLFSITVPQLVAQGMSTTDYAAGIFVGLIVFNLFSELAYRAPTLLHEHVTFVKKSIFPSETIAWMATIRAFVYGGVSFGVYIAFRLVTVHDAAAGRSCSRRCLILPSPASCWASSGS